MAVLKLSQLSIFWRLFIGFIVVAVPLFIVSSVTIAYSTDFIADKVQQATKVKMEFFMKSLEKELENISQMLVALNNDPDLVSLYSLQDKAFDFESVALLQSIKTKMNIVYYSSEYIADVFLLLPGSDRQFSQNSGLSPINANKSAALARYVQSQKRLDRYTQTDILTYLIGFSTQSNNEKVEYLLGVDIKQSRILKSFQEYGIDDEFSKFLYDNVSGRLIDERSLSDLDRSVYRMIKRNGSVDGSIGIDGESYFVRQDVSKDGLFSLVSYIDKKDILQPIYLFRNISLLLFLMALLCFLIFSMFVYRQIHRPLSSLTRAMKAVEIGNYKVKLMRTSGDEFSYVFLQYNRMAEQLNTLFNEVLEKKIQLQASHLKQLQSQINPHFLFNCFYIGYRMAKSGDNENVAKLCKYLGDFFRFVTNHAQEDVKVKDEIKYMQTYLEIQKMRFSNKFDFQIRVDAEAENLLIPALTIQPLVENALVHGIERQNAEGRIFVQVGKRDGWLTVEIEDSGAGMSDEAKRMLERQLQQPENPSKHNGIWNVHWRLQHRYREGSRGIVIGDREGGGLKVGFQIAEQACEVGGGESDV